VFFTVDYGTAELRGHGLHAVADAQHRHAELEHALRGARGFGHGHGFRATGEDHAGRVEGADFGIVHVEGADLAVDTDFTHAACDQLRVRRAEIQNQDALGMNVFHGQIRLRPDAGRRTPWLL